jgi:hypothetical protein
MVGPVGQEKDSGERGFGRAVKKGVVCASTVGPRRPREEQGWKGLGLARK